VSENYTPCVYLAGPLSGIDACTYLQNVNRFVVVDRQLRALGFAVYDPALDLIVGIYDGEMGYEDFFDSNVAWVGRSDALLRIPGPSAGADREVERAEELLIPVFAEVYDLCAYFDVKVSA